MKPPLLILFPTLIPLLASSQPSPVPDGVYEKAMDRTLARAQADLQKATKLRETRTWKNPWEATSKYFTVRTTSSFAQARSLAASFDEMAPLIRGLLKPDFQWTKPMPVWIVPDIATYNQIGNAGGDAHSSNYGSHLATGQVGRPVVVLAQANEQYLKIIATHSLVHQIIDRAYPNTRARVWVQEGLAAYFSLYWDWNWAATQLAGYEKAKTQIPVRTLLTRSVAAMGGKMQKHCIELGMFFNYLLHYREDTKSTIDANKVQQGPFAEYLRLALSGKRTNEHAVHKLIFRSVKGVEAGFRAQVFRR
jgi:hypothetical protein